MNETREAIAEIRREIRVRNNIYPKLIADGRLSGEEARRRITALELAVSLLQHEAVASPNAPATTVQSWN